MAKEPDRFGGEAMSTRLIPSPTLSAAVISDLQLVGDEYSPRWGLAAAALEDKVYLFGGYIWYHGAERFHGDFYEVDVRHMTIRSLPLTKHEVHPRARFGHTLVAVPHRRCLLMFGGRDSDYCFAELWQYCLVDERWTLLSPGIEGRSHPSPRSWHSADMNGNHMYIIGGWGQESDVLSEVWRFDIETVQWKCLCSPQQSRPRAEGIAPNALPHQGLGNGVGGYVPSSVEDGTGGTGGVGLGGSIRWSDLFLTKGRTCHQSVIWRNAIYLFGGVVCGNQESSPDLVKFDLHTNEWSHVPTIGSNPGKRVSAAGTLVGDSWVLHGGMTSMPGGLGKTTSDVYQFDFLTSTWSRKAELCLLSGVSGVIDVPKVERSRVLRYGHAATTLVNGTPVFFGGAEAYASASSSLSWRIEFLPSVGQIRALTDCAAKEREERRMAAHEVRAMSELVNKANSTIQLLDNECRHWRQQCEVMASTIDRLRDQIDQLERKVGDLTSGLVDVKPILEALGTFADTVTCAKAITPNNSCDTVPPSDRFGSAPARALQHRNNSTAAAAVESHL